MTVPMHEISLVRNIFSTLEEEFPERMGELRGIYLKVGLLSNVQPILMQNAFDAVIQDEKKYGRTSLHVEVLPIRIYCEQCRAESEVNHFRFVCASCGTPSTQIIQGNEMLITKVEFEQ